MSAETTKVDVLAVMDKLCVRYIANRGTKSQFISCVTPEVFGDDAALRKSDIAAAWLDLAEARAAVAELIEASARAIPFLRDEAAQYDDDGSNEPLETLRDLEAALARIGGDT